MKLARFARMSPPRQNASLIAVQVHNTLRDTYGDALSSDQLQAFDETVRNAVYAAISVLNTESGKPDGARTFDRLIEQVPDSWDREDDQPDAA